MGDVAAAVEVELRENDVKSLAGLLDQPLQLIQNLIFPIGGLGILSLPLGTCVCKTSRSIL